MLENGRGRVDWREYREVRREGGREVGKGGGMIGLEGVKGEG